MTMRVVRPERVVPVTTEGRFVLRRLVHSAKLDVRAIGHALVEESALQRFGDVLFAAELLGIGYGESGTTTELLRGVHVAGLEPH